MEKFKIEPTPHGHEKRKEDIILQKLARAVPNGKKNKTSNQNSPKQAILSKRPVKRQSSQVSKISSKKLFKTRSSNSNCRIQKSQQNRNDISSMRSSQDKNSISVSIESDDSDRMTKLNNSQRTQGQSFNLRLSNVNESLTQEKEGFDSISGDVFNNDSQSIKKKPRQQHIQQNQYSEISRSDNSDQQDTVFDESNVSVMKTKIKKRQSNSQQVPISNESQEISHVPDSQNQLNQVERQNNTSPMRKMSNITSDVMSPLTTQKGNRKKMSGNLKTNKQISVVAQMEDEIKLEIKQQISKIYQEELVALALQNDPNFAKSIVKIQVMPKKGNKKQKSPSRDSKLKGKITNKLQRQNGIRREMSFKQQNIRAQVIEEDYRESFDLSDDQHSVRETPLTITKIQNHLQNLMSKNFQNQMNELQEQMVQYPNKFKLLATDNRTLIDIYKFCIGQKLSFDDQQEMMTSQIEEFGEKMNQSLAKCFNLQVPDIQEQSQKLELVSNKPGSQQNKLSKQKTLAKDKIQPPKLEEPIDQDITIGHLVKPVLTNKGVLKGVQIRPEVLQVALYEDEYDTKIVRLLIKSICFINRILHSGHEDNYDLKVIVRDMEKTQDQESQVNEKELESNKVIVDNTLVNHLILLEQRLQEYKYDRESYYRVDAIAEYNSYEIFDHRLRGVYDTFQNKQIDNPLAFGEYLQVVLNQVGNQINLLQPDFSEKLVLQNLIDISDEKLKKRKKMITRHIQTQPTLCVKSTQTDKKYIYEGEKDIAARSVKMLTIDKHLDDEFSKTLEMFDIFVSQPGFIERQTVKRIQTVIDKLTIEQNSTHLPELEYEQPDENFDDQVANINNLMDHYLKVIEQRNTLLELIEQFLEKQDQIREAERKQKLEQKNLLNSFVVPQEQPNSLNLNSEFNTPELWIEPGFSSTMNETPAQSYYDIRSKAKIVKGRKRQLIQRMTKDEKKQFDQRKRLASLIVDCSTNLSKKIIDKPRATIVPENNSKFKKMYNSIDVTNMNNDNMEIQMRNQKSKLNLNKQYSKMSDEDETTIDMDSNYVKIKQVTSPQPTITIKYNKINFKKNLNDQEAKADSKRFDLPNLQIRPDQSLKPKLQKSQAANNISTQITQNDERQFLKKLYSKSPEFGNFNFKTPKGKLKHIQRQNDANFDQQNVRMQTEVQNLNLSFTNDRKPMQTQTDFLPSPRGVSQYRSTAKRMKEKDLNDESLKEVATQDQSLNNQESKYLSSSKQIPSMETSLFAQSNVRANRQQINKNGFYNKSIR